MNKPQNFTLLLLMAIIMTACEPKAPTLFEINDAYVMSLGSDYNYSIRVEPLANEEIPTTREMEQRASKIVYYEVYLVTRKTYNKQVVMVFPMKNKTQINTDEFIVNEHRYFSVYQDVIKQNINVFPVVVDAAAAMKILCESTAESLSIPKVCN